MPILELVSQFAQFSPKKCVMRESCHIVKDACTLNNTIVNVDLPMVGTESGSNGIPVMLLIIAVFPTPDSPRSNTL